MISRLCLLSLLVDVSLATRAFPLASEEYVIRLFETINKNIVYDESNFLVDLSGRYVTCEYAGQRGTIEVSEVQESGAPIYGLIDYGYGSETDVGAVNQHIQDNLDTWPNDPQFEGVITASTMFGCSVRPGCDTQYVIGCLFNGRRIGGNLEFTTPLQGGGTSGLARAFTEDQHLLAELLTGIDWDNSHFLEDLAADETECAMIAQPEWNWAKSQTRAMDMEGMHVTGVTGSTLNLGETEPAMLEIIDTQIVPKLYKSTFKLIGCSIIPDCVFNNELYVVVGCLISY